MGTEEGLGEEVEGDTLRGEILVAEQLEEGVAVESLLCSLGRETQFAVMTGRFKFNRTNHPDLGISHSGEESWLGAPGGICFSSHGGRLPSHFQNAVSLLLMVYRAV